jgi:hypothetical protein
LLFGQLIKRATLVQNYPSDLYYDAMWITQNVNGPTGFYWMARLNGTNIADRAVIQEQITTREPRSLYWIDLTEDGGEWTATFTELVHVRDDPPTGSSSHPASALNRRRQWS